MPGSKRTHDKQLQRKKALAARAAAQKAADRKRRLTVGGAVVLVVGLIIGLVLALGGGDDDATDVAADNTSTTTPASSTPAAESSAGKPCVKRVDPLPAGAPEVPVEEGPPPAKLIMTDLVEGTGEQVGAAAEVTVNYIGVACSTGKVFDSSYSRGQPATFGLNGVIPGWTQGIPGMKVGGQRLLGIPSALAYGEDGNPPSIAPDEALWFVVEILSTTPAPDQ